MNKKISGLLSFSYDLKAGSYHGQLKEKREFLCLSCGEKHKTPSFAPENIGVFHLTEYGGYKNIPHLYFGRICGRTNACTPLS